MVQCRLYSGGEVAVNNDLISGQSVSARTRLKKTSLLDVTRKLGIVSAEYGDPAVFARPTAPQRAQTWSEGEYRDGRTQFIRQ